MLTRWFYVGGGVGDSTNTSRVTIKMCSACHGCLSTLSQATTTVTVPNQHQQLKMSQLRQAVSSFPWLAFCSLCAEEQYEMEEGVWKALLLALKNDAKITIDAALKTGRALHSSWSVDQQSHQTRTWHHCRQQLNGRREHRDPMPEAGWITLQERQSTSKAWISLSRIPSAAPPKTYRLRPKLTIV
eukprot:Em0881g2a